VNGPMGPDPEEGVEGTNTSLLSLNRGLRKAIIVIYPLL
jgi:hypothetical protein